MVTADIIEKYGWWAFPAVFAGIWFVAVTLLSVLSGWYVLAGRFRDRPEQAILALKRQSGTIGMVGASHSLRLSVCPGGLRVGMLRVFGPFCRDFFVPWSEITVRRRNRILWKSAELKFGRPTAGRLIIAPYVANQLAHAAGASWPESGVFLPETTGQRFRRTMAQALLPVVILPVFMGVVTHLPSFRAEMHVSEGQIIELIAVITAFYVALFGTFGLLGFFVDSLKNRGRD